MSDAQLLVTVKSLTEDLERARKEAAIAGAQADEYLDRWKKAEKELEGARFNESVMSAEKWLERFNKSQEELDQTRRELRLMQEQNLAHHKRLDAVDELCTEWCGTGVPDATFAMGERLCVALQNAAPAPTLPYPDVVHAAFHWRDPKRADGMYDALCGDGFGFLGATDTKLTLQFDCAGVHACADIPFDQLREVLATEGLFIGKVTDWNPLGSAMHTEAKDLADKLCQARNEIDELTRKLAFVDKLTEQIATIEDRRVLDAVAALPPSAVYFMSSQLGPGAALTPKSRAALDRLVSFELARRIQNADLDLPLHMTEAEAIETTHERLTHMLDEAIQAGEQAKTMTPEQREARYEAFIREKGWLKDGEKLDRSRRRNVGREVLAGVREIKQWETQQGETDDRMQVRDVQADSAPEPEPD